ncbi:CYTH domain-containing protein [Oceanobacillus sp. 143]|uniref:Adenylate cyclase n=1 Tax=Oceanobacillus zhaokaii TaxID=2052660 RepID=A0A345PFL6_9BACI|nr:CYTH domain-containing protein [Oceanobacillus zhaokaii]AXI08796.1 adenylate cyclase [Oceanobacillus zhaokaii]QGS68500.1 CYTH domain-containing protein [Oceanobacillus sp. 143]
MAQEIEIEYKNLLTKDEFQRLLDNLPFPEYSEVQTNYYFETKDFQLKENGSALRIREKNGSYRLTLKEPHTLGLLETHDVLTKQEATDWVNGKIIPKEHIAKQLLEKGIAFESLSYYGSLITERREAQYKGVLIVLDISKYNGKTDYEFELEAQNKDVGLETFLNILSEYNIRKKQTPNKIQRFFESLP